MLDTAAGGWYHISGAGIRQAEKTERRGQTMAYKNSRQNAAETKTSSEKNEKKLKKLVYGLRIGAAAYLLLALFGAAAVNASGAAESADWNTVSRHRCGFLPYLRRFNIGKRFPQAQLYFP